VTFAKVSVRDLLRNARVHTVLMACASAAILLLGFTAPRHNWSSDWRNKAASANETEIDAALQDAATAALAGREGTIIVMDPQTGRIRAVVNPELAFEQAVMPGSTMKPFTALAALRSGVIDTDSRTVCPGRFTGRSFSLPCVHADHLPPFTPSQAIAYSCNYYFATLGQRLSRDQLIETMRPFGIGQPTGVNEKEAAGTLRPCQTGNNARIRRLDRGTPQGDCDAREAIGESDHIEVSPIQLLSAYAALVNGGHLMQPREVSVTESDPVMRSQIEINAAHRAIIIEGLRGAVRFGTAKSADLDSLPLAILGKTGTALPAKGYRTNGWFVGFAGPPQSSVAAPSDVPPSEINLAVLVFLTRSHGAEAAAVSKSVFQTYAETSKDTEMRRHGDAENNIPVSPRLPLSASPVRVHLVTENVTQELALEDYVLGVLRAEGSMEAEPEALEALAIAIRTYALKNHNRHAKDGYDFCTTTHCQRFVGGNASVAMIEAVRATEGQVLRDGRGQIVDAYFGASCGGETANIGALWGTNPPGYLRGVRDEYCVSGAHANWRDVITRSDLLRALNSDARTDIGLRLDNVIVSKRDETGRAEFITIEGDRRKQVRGWDFKIIVGRVLGWNVLKSSRFEIGHAGSGFIFRGSGFGHGLGLCQEGAHVMAQRGVSHQRILEKYFPGTTVKRDAGTRIGDTGTRGRGDTGRFEPGRGWSDDVLLRAAPRVAVSPRLRVPVPRVPASPRLRVTLSPATRLLTISSEHFRVTHPADVDRRDADLVLRTLETARADYLRRASAAVPISGIPLLEVRLNESTGDFTGRTGQPWWAAAATRGNKIELQPVVLLKKRGVLTTTLRHELAHVLIDTVSHNRAPRWLEEGLALYLAGEGPMISRYANKTKLSQEEIEKRLVRPGSQKEMRTLYAAAYQLVRDLIGAHGESSVWQQLARS